MNDAPSVLSLIARWEEAKERGQIIPAEDLCRDCPHLLAEVRAGIERLFSNPGWQTVPLPDVANNGPPTRIAGGGTVTQPPEQTRAAAEDSRPDGVRVPGYEILEMLGEGGMGVVFRARDVALQRDVAIKFLKEKMAGTAEHASRFLEEARITGQLQHPGVPPVHQLGTLPDGRPFLAMKLIKGQTLSQLMASREGARPESSLDVLAIFESLCQVIGYAHARQVIHRDLKPQNVMVGSFGELQLMDWGLAKVLASGGRKPSVDETQQEADSKQQGANAPGTPTAIKSLRDLETVAGSVMGTLAYMAPEQAAGISDKVDTRSDVFGLGAVLCCLLTGQPPFGGATSEAVWLNAVRGATADAFARLDACGADAEVVALCKRCLALERDQRPADGAALVDWLQAHRHAQEEKRRHAEEAKAAAEKAQIQAEADRAKAETLAAQAKAEKAAADEAKARGRVRAAAAMTALLFLGLVGLAVLWQDARTERRKADAAAVGEKTERGKAETAAAGEKKAREDLEHEKSRSETALRGKIDAEKKAKDDVAEQIARFRYVESIRLAQQFLDGGSGKQA